MFVRQKHKITLMSSNLKKKKIKQEKKHLQKYVKQRVKF